MRKALNLLFSFSFFFIFSSEDTNEAKAPNSPNGVLSGTGDCVQGDTKSNSINGLVNGLVNGEVHHEAKL